MTIAKEEPMKIQITFKDPDSLDDCIEDGVRNYQIAGLSDEEAYLVMKSRDEKVREICKDLKYLIIMEEMKSEEFEEWQCSTCGRDWSVTTLKCPMCFKEEPSKKPSITQDNNGYWTVNGFDKEMASEIIQALSNTFFQVDGPYYKFIPKQGKI